ncbi:hypothetical protein MKW92_016232 [Papaver armeniacum]|nr:hypothetical protein MKW92_016232 [Papaver armeniacum]
MARRSLVISSIAFTAFIMLSIAQMALGVSRLDQVVAESGPSETEQAGVNAAHGLVDVQKTRYTPVDLDKGEATRGGKDSVSALNGLVKENNAGALVVNANKGRVENHGHTGVNIANGLADVNDDGLRVVDLQNGKVYEGEETGVKLANGLAGVKIGRHTEADIHKGTVEKGRKATVNEGNESGEVPAYKNAPVPEKSYPANNKNVNGSYN